jgi:hypothetical protein
MPLNKMIIPPSTPGASAAVGLDPRKGATIYVYTTGAASYDVQATLDDPMTTAPANIRWVTSVDVPAGQIGSYSGKITTPCNALRLNVASNAAALEVRVLQ